MEELLRKMIKNLCKQVEEKVPGKGTFPIVYEREDVTKTIAGLSHLILKVTSVDLPGKEDKRYLELGAVNYPSPYGAECVVGHGTTQDILDQLQNYELLDKLMEKVSKLVEEIDYEERHPWG